MTKTSSPLPLALCPVSGLPILHKLQWTINNSAVPYLDDILAYLGAIDWEEPTLQPTSEILPSHPYKAVFDAITLLKSEVDDLLQERGQTLKALQQRDDVHNLFVKHAPAAIAICDKQMRYLANSARWARDYSLEEGNLVGQCHYDLFPDLPEHWKGEHQRCFQGEIIRREEESFPRANGSMDWVRRELHPWKNKAGEIGGLIMFAEVVTERRLAQEALKASEKKYRRMMENAPMGVYQVLLDGTFLMVNRKMAEIFGFSSPETFLEKVDNIKNLYLKPSERPQILQKIDREGYIQRKEVAFKKPDGDTIWIHLNARKGKNSSGEFLYEGLLEDITELKRTLNEKETLRERLMQTQKTEAIADLAGGIAHEFNNALMGITGNIELLKIKFPHGTEKDPYLESMMTATHRMANLTEQLLAYARDGRHHAKPLFLSEFLHETLPIIKHSLDSRIRVETVVPEDIHSIRADPTQMQMVLSAVLNNAGEAIEGDGCITISAKNQDVEEIDAEKQTTPLKQGTYVCLTLEDNGKGMDKESLARMFDPFFTTKFQGRGMGMAAAYGIVCNHGGWISVESKPLKGTRVHIWLPALQTEGKEAPQRATLPSRAQNSILV